MPSLRFITMNCSSPENHRIRVDSRSRHTDLLNRSSMITRTRRRLRLPGFARCWRIRLATCWDSPTYTSRWLSIVQTTGQSSKRGCIRSIDATRSPSNAMVSSSKLVIFGAAPLRLLHRILAAGALELVEQNLFRGEVQAVCEEQCIGQHIGQFVGDAVAVRVPVPLEAFEQFAGLDGYRLGQILGGMELSPITFGHECSQGLEGGLADHSGNLTGPYDSGCAAEVLRTVRMWSGPGDQAFSCCWVGWLTVAPALLAASPP